MVTRMVRAAAGAGVALLLGVLAEVEVTRCQLPWRARPSFAVHADEALAPANPEPTPEATPGPEPRREVLQAIRDAIICEGLWSALAESDDAFRIQTLALLRALPPRGGAA